MAQLRPAKRALFTADAAQADPDAPTSHAGVAHDYFDDVAETHHPATKCWWDWSTPDPIVAMVYFPRHPAVPIKLSRLGDVGPFQLIPNVLESEVANRLLREQLQEFQHHSPNSSGPAKQGHKAIIYKDLNLRNGTRPSVTAQESTFQDDAYATATATTAEAIAAAATAAAAAAAAARYDSPQPQAKRSRWNAAVIEPTELVRQVSYDVSTAVNALRASRPAYQHYTQQVWQLQQKVHSDRTAPAVWNASHAAANWYSSGKDSFARHSDEMSVIGPFCTIAGLSLGAGRVFRLHPKMSPGARVSAAAAAAAMRIAAAGDGAGTSAAASSAAASGSPTPGSNSGCDAPPQHASHVDVHLPHNSLLVMHPPTQEEWQHEVPQATAFSPCIPHCISGTARVSLTFRMWQADVWGRDTKEIANCFCGNPAIIRSRMVAGQHVYEVKCAGSMDSCCDFTQEVARLDAAG